MYNKSADKQKCEKSYSKISESEREEIKKKLPLYLKTIKDKQYQKNPLTYLTGKCWNDIDEKEIEKELFDDRPQHMKRYAMQ
jgi:methionine salvage enolase-phosphatase E1